MVRHGKGTEWLWGEAEESRVLTVVTIRRWSNRWFFLFLLSLVSFSFLKKVSITYIPKKHLDRKKWYSRDNLLSWSVHGIKVLQRCKRRLPVVLSWDTTAQGVKARPFQSRVVRGRGVGGRDSNVPQQLWSISLPPIWQSAQAWPPLCRGPCGLEVTLQQGPYGQGRAPYSFTQKTEDPQSLVSGFQNIQHHHQEYLKTPPGYGVVAELS